MQTVELIAGPLTILLWLIALTAGAVAFARTKRDHEAGRVAMRLMFGMLVVLAVWSVLSYCLWLAGVPLKIGTIRDGRMAENWWLPGATVIAAALTYRSLK